MPTQASPSAIPTLENVNFKTTLSEFLRSVIASSRAREGALLEVEMADGGTVFKVRVDVTVIALPTAGSDPELRH